MSKQFTISYPGDKAQLITKLKNMIGNNGTLAGDENNGNFKGSTPVGGFEGSYSIQGDNITVTLDKKPMLVSTDMIKSEFQKALKKGL
jgi:hypothetical protein